MKKVSTFGMLGVEFLLRLLE